MTQGSPWKKKTSPNISEWRWPLCFIRWTTGSPLSQFLFDVPFSASFRPIIHKWSLWRSFARERVDFTPWERKGSRQGLVKGVKTQSRLPDIIIIIFFLSYSPLNFNRRPHSSLLLSWFLPPLMKRPGWRPVGRWPLDDVQVVQVCQVFQLSKCFKGWRRMRMAKIVTPFFCHHG